MNSVAVQHDEQLSEPQGVGSRPVAMDVANNNQGPISDADRIQQESQGVDHGIVEPRPRAVLNNLTVPVDMGQFGTVPGYVAMGHANLTVPVDMGHANMTIPVDIGHANMTVPVDIGHANMTVPVDIGHANMTVPVYVSHASLFPVDVGHANMTVPVYVAHASLFPVDVGHANLIAEARQLYEDHGTLNKKHTAMMKYCAEIQCQHDIAQERLDGLEEENVALKQKLSKFESEKELYANAIQRISFLDSEVDFLKLTRSKYMCEKTLLEEKLVGMGMIEAQATMRAEEEHKLTIGYKRQGQELQNQLESVTALYDLQQKRLNDVQNMNQRLRREQQLLRPRLEKVLPDVPSDHENCRFRIEHVNDVLMCSRCHQTPDSSVQCYNHPGIRCPYKVWKDWFPLEVGFGPDYSFWPCCQKFSVREPQGCQMLEEHMF